MEYITSTLGNLMDQTAFFNLTVGNYVMILVACVFLYLAIAKGFEPLLLVPIAFGMLLVNIYPDIMMSIEESSNGVGGLLHYFYLLDEWAILPSLIFMGVGAMTDFGPLIANPKSFLLGAAAQFGIFAAYLGAMAMGFSDKVGSSNFNHRWSRWTDIYFPCRKIAADCNFRTDRSGGILLYVTRSYHSTSDHEAIDNRKRT